MCIRDRHLPAGENIPVEAVDQSESVRLRTFLWNFEFKLFLPFLAFTGDNISIVNQCNGVWRSASREDRRRTVVDLLFLLSSQVAFKPIPKLGKFFFHVPRAKNRRADRLANEAMDQRINLCSWEEGGVAEFRSCFRQRENDQRILHVRFDGGFRAEAQIAGTGFCMELVQVDNNNVVQKRSQILAAGTFEMCADSYSAESRAAYLSVRAILQLLSKAFSPSAIV